MDERFCVSRGPAFGAAWPVPPLLVLDLKDACEVRNFCKRVSFSFVVVGRGAGSAAWLADMDGLRDASSVCCFTDASGLGGSLLKSNCSDPVGLKSAQKMVDSRPTLDRASSRSMSAGIASRFFSKNPEQSYSTNPA